MALQLAPQKLLRNPLVVLGGVVIVGGMVYWAYQEGYLDWLLKGDVVPPDPGVQPPVIPPQNPDYQMSRINFDCKDVGIHDLQDWTVLLGVRPTPPTRFIVHIVIKDTTNGAEVAHLIDSRLVGNTTNHEYITHSMSNDKISGLNPCTTYNGYCYVTNADGTMSVAEMKTSAWRTRGCA